jgi:chromosome segregation ATPase
MNAVFVPKSESNNWGDEMEDSLGELRSDVRHIQSDVTDIKADVRAVNVRLDKFQDKFEEFRKDTAKEFTAVRSEFGSKFEKIQESLASAKVWALWLYIGLAASMFYVLARGFKWL